VDLHAFAMPGARGRYWYIAGVNPAALIGWGAGVALGLMFSTTTLFTGPLESSVSGVDLSWLMAAVVGGLVYLALTPIFSARTHESMPIALPDQAGEGRLGMAYDVVGTVAAPLPEA
jgi:cytosine/uracil/thiamine/allantoin permease